MKIFQLLLIFLCLNKTFEEMSFTEMLQNLKILESYVSEYVTQKSTSSFEHIIITYIRTGKYDTAQWNIAAGSLPSDFLEFLDKKQSQSRTKVEVLRKIGEIETPTMEKIDFVHLFAVMNGIEFCGSFTDKFSGLVGWAGDLAQLFQDISKKTGTLEELLAEANNFLGKKGQFGAADLISDLDAPNLYKLRLENKNTPFSEIFFKYYNRNYYKGKNYLNRVYNFVVNTFPEMVLYEKNKYREIILRRYNKDVYINVLECKYGLRKSIASCYIPGEVKSQFKNHQKAAVFSFSDYIYEKYSKP